MAPGDTGCSRQPAQEPTRSDRAGSVWKVQGDTPSPPAWRWATTGSVLPVVTDRLVTTTTRRINVDGDRRSRHCSPTSTHDPGRPGTIQ